MSKDPKELSRTDSEVGRSEFWKIVDRTKPEKLRALSDEEIRDCQNYFLEILDSTLPAYESVTASLRLILLRGEIDLGVATLGAGKLSASYAGRFEVEFFPQL